MTERVKITQEQEDILLKIIDNSIFHTMKIRDVAAALTGDYEVEPEFKVGDWVVDEYLGLVQVQEVESDGVWIGKSPDSLEWRRTRSDGINSINNMRHATPEEKERRWWEKHGRDVWGIEEDDILEYLNDLYIVDCFDSEKVCLKSGIERKTNYAEPFNFVKKHFKVVCFAEDRKDVDHEC